jgi:hypothetical protein
VTIPAGQYYQVWASGKNRPAQALAPFTVVPLGSVWKYLASGVDQGTVWRDSTFNDSSWNSGPGMFGYGGTTSYGTVLSFRSSSSNKWRTYYFRKQINIADVSQLSQLTMLIQIDDGAVYINGVEAVRRNMPSGTITYSTFANVTVGTIDESTHILPMALFVDGMNTIAVEVHQVNASSSDLRFDFRLNASGSQTHTNFTIADGEVIALTNSNNSYRDTTPVLNLQANLSTGRFLDGAATWK